MTNKEKRKLVARLIELYVNNGIEIVDIVCRPISFFDFKLVKESISHYEEKEQTQK